MAKSRKPRKTTEEIKAEIVAKVVAALEKGTVPWRKPWKGGGAVGANAMPLSLSSRKAYRGSNVWTLLVEQMVNPEYSNVWGTYRQITEAGGQVRKGEKSTTVVLWKKLQRKVEGEEKPKGFMWMTTFAIFNIAQADWDNGLPKWIQARTATVADTTGSGTEHETDGFELAEATLQGYFDREAPILAMEVKLSDLAYYSPLEDKVVLPEQGQFDSLNEWYSTAFHEAAHSTGGITRLNRPGITEHNPFGSHGYSREELVAEMSAAMLCGITGIDLAATLDNSVAYLAHWATALRSDPDLLFKAATAAEAAVARIAPEATVVEDERADDDPLGEYQAWVEAGVEEPPVVEAADRLAALAEKLRNRPKRAA